MIICTLYSFTTTLFLSWLFWARIRMSNTWLWFSRCLLNSRFWKSYMRLWLCRLFNICTCYSLFIYFNNLIYFFINSSILFGKATFEEILVRKEVIWCYKLVNLDKSKFFLVRMCCFLFVNSCLKFWESKRWQLMRNI